MFKNTGFHATWLLMAALVTFVAGEYAASAVLAVLSIFLFLLAISEE